MDTGGSGGGWAAASAYPAAVEAAVALQIALGKQLNLPRVSQIEAWQRLLHTFRGSGFSFGSGSGSSPEQFVVVSSSIRKFAIINAIALHSCQELMNCISPSVCVCVCVYTGIPVSFIIIIIH